jgi:hypothetical protein
VAVSYWIGSPQTALAGTIWNVRQTDKVFRRARDDPGPWEDSMFVLSCFNHFGWKRPRPRPPARSPDAKDADVELQGPLLEGDGGGHAAPLEQLLSTLMYGLFRPLAPRTTRESDLEEEMTRELLVALAYQLRMLRRRAVIPSLTSLGTFFLAYIFSIVLAFNGTKDSTTIFNLDLGMVVSWLPPRNSM